MSLIQTASPAETPVPRAALEEHLRLSCGFPEIAEAEQPALESLLRVATATIERRLDAALIAQGWLWRLPGWPPCFDAGLPLPLRPALAIDRVALRGADGATTDWPASQWRLDSASVPPRLVPRAGFAWPAVPRDGWVEIAFTVGYGETWNDVPPELRHAVLLLAAHYYENREAAADPLAPLPFGVGGLIAPYRIIRI